MLFPDLRVFGGGAVFFGVALGQMGGRGNPAVFKTASSGAEPALRYGGLRLPAPVGRPCGLGRPEACPTAGPLPPV